MATLYGNPFLWQPRVAMAGVLGAASAFLWQPLAHNGKAWQPEVAMKKHFRVFMFPGLRRG